jgi:hypothetical protein
MLLDSIGGGIIAESQFTGLWAASCSGGTSDHSPNIWIKGSESSIRGLQFTGFRSLNGSGEGVRVEGGRDLMFDGLVTMNNQAGQPGICGYSFAAGVSHWSVHGVSGGYGTHLSVVNLQDCGVLVAAGASDWYSITGDFQVDTSATHAGNQAAAVRDNGTGTNKRVDIVGGLAWVTYTPQVRCAGTGSPPAGTFTGHYEYQGKTVRFVNQYSFTSSGTCSIFPVMKLPLGSAAMATPFMAMNHTDGSVWTASISADTNQFLVRKGDGSGAFVSNGVNLYLSGFYERR